MTKEELIKTAAFLLDKIDKRSGSANEIIGKYTATHKYISGDARKELLNLVWALIRHKARLEFLCPQASWNEKTSFFLSVQAQNKKKSDNETDIVMSQKCEKGLGKDTQTGSSDEALDGDAFMDFETFDLPSLKAAPDEVKWEVPAWIVSHIPDAASELPLLKNNAPIVLRANGNRDEIMQELLKEGIEVYKTTHSIYGLILEKYQNLTDTRFYKKGLIEIQDEGAQMVALDIGVKPRESVFDFCAGAGGKTLIFAQMMQNRGFIQAYDALPKRLFELIKRARRAGISIVKTVTRLPKPDKKFDHVVVDAPCTGTGTWRRMPDMKWKLNEKQLKKTVQLQSEILNRAAQYVKPGHFLSYITCSLTVDENEAQVEDFLASHPRYKKIMEKRYSPYRTGTDGFYLCMMQRR